MQASYVTSNEVKGTSLSLRLVVVCPEDKESKEYKASKTRIAYTCEVEFSSGTCLKRMYADLETAFGFKRNTAFLKRAKDPNAELLMAHPWQWESLCMKQGPAGIRTEWLM